MARKPNYWIVPYPSGTKRWQGATSGTSLAMEKYRGQLFHLYRRYAKQWNDIELDQSRRLSEHTHRICDAHVVGSGKQFVLTWNLDRDTGWILEISFVRGFRQFYPGWSTGLNTLRSESDVKSAVLHWRGHGREAFDQWLVREHTENASKGEWAEYKA